MRRKGLNEIVSEVLLQTIDPANQAFSADDSYQVFSNFDFSSFFATGDNFGGVVDTTLDQIRMEVAGAPATGLPVDGLYMRSGGVGWNSAYDFRVFFDYRITHAVDSYAGAALVSAGIVWYDASNVPMAPTASDYADITSLVTFTETENTSTAKKWSFVFRVPRASVPEGATYWALRTVVSSTSQLSATTTSLDITTLSCSERLLMPYRR